MIENELEKTLARLLYFGLPLITVFLINGSVTDPVNVPKFFLLGAVAVASLLVMLGNPAGLLIRGMRTWFALTALFALISVLVLLASPAPIVQSMYGVYGRNSGFLTYIFLSMILLASAQIRVQKNFEKILYGLLCAGVVNVLYCGWVLAFGEILSWNNPYGNILGTFGNPNFIGAYLGIFVTVWFAFAVAPGTHKYYKFASLLLLPLAFIEIVLSNAIQGRVLMLAGFGLVGFFWLHARFRNIKMSFVYGMAMVLVGSFALAGALQKGPLAAYIYKRSVSLRGQYWLAGWKTGSDHPLSGVGFDSFGDWYRRARDAHALDLPGINTVVNTAHNVPLDIFASGGWPLFLSYIALLAYTAVKIFKLFTVVKSYDPIFVGLVSAWFTYQLQSIISINQIGLAVWGWSLSGLIVAYEFVVTRRGVSKDDQNGFKVKRAKSRVISYSMLAGIGLLVGALISVPPLNADVRWRSAQVSRDASQLESSLKPSYMNPQNTFKLLNVIQVFEENGLNELAHTYALEAVKFNPESYDSWKFLFLIKNSTDPERATALSNMKRLDPLNPDVTAN
jgi:O-antigen ligase